MPTVFARKWVSVGSVGVPSGGFIVGHVEVDVDTGAEVESCAPGGSQSTAKKRRRATNCGFLAK